MSPRIRYQEWRPSASSQDVIDRANTICEAYRQQGFDLTLRQLYYQFVARDLIPNNERSYKRLGSIVNDARMAGLLDWNYITDRTRGIAEPATWDDPTEIVASAASSFNTDKWADQPNHVEVWVEKDALVGVIARACDQLDVPYLSCRGYVSQSEAWRAGKRMTRLLAAGKDITILHLGDHDPSGIDMSRDIEERLLLFAAGGLQVDHAYTVDDAYEAVRDRFRLDRIALNWDQIEQYGPPPNPAKITDSRARAYIDEYGGESWELDALEPAVLADLIYASVNALLDDDLWQEAVIAQEHERKILTAVADRWDDVRAYLEEDAS